MSESEFSIIDKYFKTISEPGGDVVLGPGDDCAILRVPAGMELCVSTDTLISGVHFPANAPAMVVANRTVGSNLSDLAAMGAQPTAFLLALTVPEINEPWIQDFSAQLKYLTERFAVPLIGGNMSKGPMSLTMTVMGVIPAGQAIRRDTAQTGDDIYVSGQIGVAGIGLEHFLLRRVSPAVASYTSPEPRLALGMALRGLASAMVDVSDGLAADVAHLLEASGKGGDVALDLVPYLTRTPKPKEMIAAVTAGDDYELCFTAAVDRRDEVAAISSQLGLPLTRIGRVTDGEVRLLVDEEQIVITRNGYDHFRSWGQGSAR